MPGWWYVARAEKFGTGRSGILLKGTSIFAAAARPLLDAVMGGVPGEEEYVVIETLGDLISRWAIVSGSSPTMTDPFVDRLHTYVGTNLHSEDISPAGAAHALGCSLRTVHQICRRDGTTFGKLVLHYRLNRAMSRLAGGEKRISAVAFDCGFSSLSHFCRTFKAKFQVTAREVIRQHGIQNAP